MPITTRKQHWEAITSSSDGRKIAAFFDARVWTSSDGGNIWAMSIKLPGDAQDVTSSSDGMKLAVVEEEDGGIWTSSDRGVTWKSTTVGGSGKSWKSITSSSDGTKLAAVEKPSSDGYKLPMATNIWTSIDSGMTWKSTMLEYGTEESSSEECPITSSSDGTMLAAVVHSGTIWTSTDWGVTWTKRGSVADWASIASTSDGTKLVALSGDRDNMWISIDSGATWEKPVMSYNGKVNNKPGDDNVDKDDDDNNGDDDDGPVIFSDIAMSSDGTKLAAVAFGAGIWTSTDGGSAWVRDKAFCLNCYDDIPWMRVAMSGDGTIMFAAAGGAYAGKLYSNVNPTSKLPFNGGFYKEGARKMGR